MASIKYRVNESSYNDIFNHLNACNIFFIPQLSEKVAIDIYSKKLKDHATRVEAWKDDLLIGLIAFYYNDEKSFVFITSVSTLDNFKGLGVAKGLMLKVINKAQRLKCNAIKLEVNKSNIKAIDLYKSFDFEIESKNQENYLMKKTV